MFSYDYQLFIIIYVNFKFYFNSYKYHGHEKAHVNLLFYIHVPHKENGNIIIKIKTSYSKRNEVVFQRLFFHVPSLTDKTHILNPTHVISFTFNHFFQLALKGFSIQLHKCLTWAPFGLS